MASSSTLQDTASKGTFSLENILGEGHELVEHPGLADNAASAGGSGWDEESTEKVAAEGFCIECEGMRYFLAQKFILSHFLL